MWGVVQQLRGKLQDVEGQLGADAAMSWRVERQLAFNRLSTETLFRAQDETHRQEAEAEQNRVGRWWKAEKKELKEVWSGKVRELHQRYSDLELEKAEAVLARRRAARE